MGYGNKQGGGAPMFLKNLLIPSSEKEQVPSKQWYLFTK
jgi:hypothetical protein